MMINVLYFTAQWCQPCKRLLPILSELLDENKDFTLTKYDIDDSAKKAVEYKVQAVPTLVFLYDDGSEVHRNVGLRSKKELEKIFEEVRLKLS